MNKLMSILFGCAAVMVIAIYVAMIVLVAYGIYWAGGLIR